MITKEQLTEWQKLCDEATPGPWEEDAGLVTADDCFKGLCYDISDEDAAFIVAARTAMPALIARVIELEAMLCPCGKGSPQSYEGPLEDCPIHGVE